VTHHANAESTRSTVRERSAAEPLVAIFHQLPKRDSKACLASDSHSGRGATARQGGDSPNGLFPGPSGSGVFSDPKAGAAANFATPAVRVHFRGTRGRKEQRGRPISSLRGFPSLRPGSPALPLSFFASIGTGGGARRFAVPSSRPTAPASVATPGGAKLWTHNPPRSAGGSGGDAGTCQHQLQGKGRGATDKEGGAIG
jgi:hypothetical protein